jgi:hypothetical protein
MCHTCCIPDTRAFHCEISDGVVSNFCIMTCSFLYSIESNILVAMYVSYIYGSRESSLQHLHRHLTGHAGIGELTLPVKYCQDFCKSSFTTINNFTRHLKNFHGHADTDATSNELSCRFQGDRFDVLFESDSTIPQVDDHGVTLSPNLVVNTPAQWLGFIQEEGASLVANLRAKGNIPYNAISEIVQSFNRMSSSMVAHFEAASSEMLMSAGVGDSIAQNAKTLLESHMTGFSEPLHLLSSTYKQDIYFDNHPLAVKPETVDFSPRYEMSLGSTV